MSENQFSLIDELLNDTEPNWNDVGLSKPKQMGDQFKQLTKSEADDAFLDEVGGNSEHTIIPLARTAAGAREPHPVKDSVTGDSALTEAFKTFGEVQKHNELDVVSQKEAENRINYLLSLGHKPSRVAKMVHVGGDGALHVYNESQTNEFIKDQEPESKARTEKLQSQVLGHLGGLGMSYINPNFHMNSCEASFVEIQKNGKLNALSVKKIAACAGCSKYKNGSCGLYCRPVVASAAELKKVAEDAVRARGIKSASLKSALVQMHEGTDSHIAKLPSRSTMPVAVRTAGDKAPIVRKEASVAEIGKMLSSGIPVKDVYKTASAQYGKVSATFALKSYIAGLRQSKAKIILAALDCSFIKGKLAAANAIVGEKKCASCSYRSGMSCGLTGGTLLSFPNMDKASSKKISHDGVKDGKQVLLEWELLDKPEDSEIEYRGEGDSTPEEINVELTSTSKIDIE